jgi:hypothetical protein
MPTFLIEVVKGEFTVHSVQDDCTDDSEAFRHAALLSFELEAAAKGDILEDCAVVVREGTGRIVGHLTLGDERVRLVPS